MDQPDEVAALIRHDAAIDFLAQQDRITHLLIDNQILTELLSGALDRCHALTLKVRQQQTAIRTYLGLDQPVRLSEMDDATRQSE